jgi:hypothetical protein
MDRAKRLNNPSMARLSERSRHVASTFPEFASVITVSLSSARIFELGCV